MTSQDKKAWLKRYTDLNKAINQKLGERDRYRSLAEKVTSAYSDMPKAPGHANNREDTYIKLAEVKNDIGKELHEYFTMRMEIEDAINTVEDITLQTLLRYRYIDGMRWKQIAVDMNYDYRYVLKLHGRALISVNIGH